jgi:hypothetical protein
VCELSTRCTGGGGRPVCGKLSELKSWRSKRGQTLQQLPQKLHSSCRRSYTAAAAEAKHHSQLLRLALRKGLRIRATGATHTTSTEAKHHNNNKSCDNIGDCATVLQQQQEATVISEETTRKSTGLDNRSNQTKGKITTQELSTIEATRPLPTSTCNS